MKNLLRKFIRLSGSVIVGSTLGFVNFNAIAKAQPSADPEKNEQNLPVISNRPTTTLKSVIGHPDWLDVNVWVVSQNNGTPDANDRKLFTSSNLATLDTKIWLDHWMDGHHKNGFNIHAIGTQRAGEILSFKIPNKLNTQWGFGNGPIGRLSLLALEYENSESFLSQLKVGKLKQSVDFTMDGVMCYFSNFGMCGWAEGTPSMIDIPGNPFNTYGAMARVGNPENVSLKYGIYQIYPESFAPKYHGLDFRIDNNTGYAQFIQLDARLPNNSLIPSRQTDHGQIRRTHLGEVANVLYESPLPPPVIKLGGWLGGGVYERVDALGESTSNNGLYGLMSVPINPGKLAMDGRLFLSGGLGLSEDVQSFQRGGNAGVVLAGVFANRPFDTLSVGYTFAEYNPLTPMIGYTARTEHALELNYSFNITPNFQLMPNLQVIMQPLGNDKASAVWVGGLQATLSF